MTSSKLVEALEAAKRHGSGLDDWHDAGIDSAIAIITVHESTQQETLRMDADQLEYLTKFHEVAQPLIGTVWLALTDGDLERAKQRMEHYRSQLPKLKALAALDELMGRG